MGILLVLIPLSLLLVAGAIAAFAWAVRDGQFEPNDDPSRVLSDDDAPRP